MSISTINNRRDKGDGLIRQRGDGRYEYRYVVGKKPDGKLIYKSFYAKTDRELKRKIKEYNEDRSKYTVKVESTSFRDYAVFWMKTVKYPILKPVSYDRPEQTYNTACNYIG
jgi:integrase